MRYAVVVDNVIENLVVAEEDWVQQQDNFECYAPIEEIQGSKNVGSTLYEDGFFYEPQPHPDWITSGDGRWRPPLETPNPWDYITISGDFGTTAEQIHTFVGVVSPDICSAITEYASSFGEWTEQVGENAHKISAHTILGEVQIGEEETVAPAYDVLSEVIEGVASLVEQTFSVEVHRPLPVLMRMGEGAVQFEHQDKMNDYYVYSDEPFLDRDLTAVVYYNDNFEGGELRFPQHNLTIAPQTGMVVIYPGDSYHTHEVLEVTSGVRYTSPLFFSIKERF